MAHGSAAVAPAGHEMTKEESGTPPSQQYMSLVSVQSDASSFTKPKPPRKHRRHQSLMSSTSVESPMRSIPAVESSNGIAGLRKTFSGKLNLDWKLGELWYARKPGKEDYSVTSEASSLPNPAINTSVEGQSRPAVVRHPSSKKPQKEWRIGELWHTRRHESDNSASTSGSSRESKLTEISSITEEIKLESPHLPSRAVATINDSDGATLDTLGVSNGDHSLHYTSLGASLSSKFNYSDVEANSEPEKSVKVELKVPLAVRWKKIQGARNWEGLLDPLDLDLRKEILRYGDFAQMAYDTFECNSRSRYAGSARFTKQEFFQNLHKSNSGYQVTRYLYATCENPLPGIMQSSLSSDPWDVHSNWMGFVAVVTDPEEIARLGRRDIVVSWRGTMMSVEWLVNLQIQMAPMAMTEDLEGGDATSKLVEMRPKVEKGFWSLYTSKRSASNFNQLSASEQVVQELTRLLTLHKGENLSITLTGHSFGGALAILTAYEIAERGLNKQPSSSGTLETIPVTIFTFGSPRIGDAVFRKRFEDFQLKALRVVNVHDSVPKALGAFHHPRRGEICRHVGVELHVDHKLSTYMKHTKDPLDWHNLECYLHLVDGFQGPRSREFKLVTGRDYALMNKAGDMLKDEYCVPANWWQLENKGLVLSSEGRWVEAKRTLEDTPSPENRERFI